MRKLVPVFLLLISSCCYAQTFDCFGGLLTYSDGVAGPTGPGGPNSQAATNISRGGTTVSATVTDGTKYAVGEPMAITGTGTALDWSASVCNSNLAQSQAGGLLITNIAGNVLTLSSPVSGTVGTTSGNIKPLRWYVATVGGVVRIFDPLDHWLFSQQVVQASDAAIAKYGSVACNTAKNEFIAWNTLGNGSHQGFNSTGQSNSDNNYYDGGSCPSNNRIPFMTEGFESSYYSDNLIQGSFTGVSQPGKDMLWATDANYVCVGISRPSLDFLDSRFQQFVQGWEAKNNSDPTFAQSAWYLGRDHQDSGVGGASPTNTGYEFNTIPANRHDCHQGLLVLATSPHQAMSANILYGGTPNGPNAFPSSGYYLYPDTLVYTKARNTLASCDYTVSSKICSLREFLQVKYSNSISSLNTAWGTSYTTFGSSETAFTSEVFGTGNGATTSFTHTMAHSNISPNSMQVSVAGTVVGGDCPSGQTSCPVVAGKGTFKGTNISGGTCTYSTGTSCTMTFSVAPANGASITVSYTTGGWGSSTPGTGLMDEDGTHLGSNNVCAQSFPAFANAHTYSIGDEIDDSVSQSWQYVTTGGTSAGAGTPTFSNTAGVTASSNGVVFTSLGPRVCGTGGTYGGTLPNANMGADMDSYLAHMVAGYLSSLKLGQAAAAPDLLNWGPDEIGVWFAPGSKGALQAANVYVDVAMHNLVDTSQDGAATAKYDFYTHYFTGATSTYQTPVSSQSAYTCNGNLPCFTTQQQKGQWWYTMTNYWLNQVGHDGLKHGAAIQWTSNVDGLQSSSFGFETDKYNPYNGHDDVTASVTCSFNAFTCGSEASASWNGTDSITHAGCGLCIADATKLWLVDPNIAVSPSFNFGQGFSLRGGSFGAPSAALICGPPTYVCSPTSLATITYPTVPPSVGGITGAGTIFTDPLCGILGGGCTPTKGVRLTDASFDPVYAGTTNNVYTPGNGSSADDISFSTDDNLTFVVSGGGRHYLLGFNPSTMAESRPYASSTTGCPLNGGNCTVNGGWAYSGPWAFSQVDPCLLYVTNPNGASILAYEFGNDVVPWSNACSNAISGPPASTTVVDFTTLSPGGCVSTACDALPSDYGTVFWTDNPETVTGDTIFGMGTSSAKYHHEANPWASSTSYTNGSHVQPTNNNPNFYSFSSSGGTSGLSEPNWNLSCPLVNNTCTDNGITWTNKGVLAGQNTGYHVTLWSTTKGFISYNTSTGQINADLGWAGGSGLTCGASNCTGTSTFGSTFTLHNVKFNKGGDKIALATGGFLTGPGCPNSNPPVWVVGTTTVYCMEDSTFTGGHWALGTLGTTNGSGTNNYSIQYRTLGTTGPGTPNQINTLPTPSCTGNSDIHIGWQMVNATDTTPIAYGRSTYVVSGGGLVPFDPLPCAWIAEVDLSDTNGDGLTHREALTFQTAYSTAFVVQQNIFTCSSDGKFCAAGSEWLNQLRNAGGTSTSCVPNGPIWSSGKTYPLNYIINPSVNNVANDSFKATVAGTASGSQPNWDSVCGTTCTDGGVTWTNIGAPTGATNECGFDTFLWKLQ